jgi:hypothetical protein
MKLNEIYDYGKLEVIEEDAKAGILKVQFPFCLADTRNGNGRTYPLAILEREVKRINEQIASGESVFGFTGHPRDAHGELTEVSHIIEKLSVTKNIGWGVASILAESNPGKTLKTILKAGGKVGSSMRGIGTVSNGIVNDDYQLLSVDYVLAPSFGKAVKFGKDSIIEKSQHADTPATRRLYAEAQDAGFDGSFEDFQKIRSTNFSERMRQVQEYLDDEARIAGKK